MKNIIVTILLLLSSQYVLGMEKIHPLISETAIEKFAHALCIPVSKIGELQTVTAEEITDVKYAQSGKTTFYTAICKNFNFISVSYSAKRNKYNCNRSIYTHNGDVIIIPLNDSIFDLLAALHETQKSIEM